MSREKKKNGHVCAICSHNQERIVRGVDYTETILAVAFTISDPLLWKGNVVVFVCLFFLFDEAAIRPHETKTS